MPFDVREEYRAVIFELKGRFLGSIEGTEFRSQLDATKEAGKRNVIVDLSKTDFMDSTAIGLLISGLTSMRKVGGDMRLAGMTKRIKNLFLITRLLGSVFEDYGTVEEALQSFVDNPPSEGGEA
jgi:anti-sigma B factor antagonist